MGSRSLYRYESRLDTRTELKGRIREIAHTRVRFGYWRVHVMLEREGWRANHKLVYRLYREEGLTLRRKRPKRHVSAVHREARTQPMGPNEAWSMDFVADQFVQGTRFRAWTVVDIFTKECLTIELGQSLKGENVVAVLRRIATQRVVPKTIFCDNAHAESFNGRLRDECLNSHWFVSMIDAKREIEAWRRDYNEGRPQDALGNRTPMEFALAAGACAGGKNDGMPETLSQPGTNSG